jgi:hypothetical protein
MPSPNTAFTAGQVLTADQQNRLPRGVMAFVQRTTSVTNLTTTYADITGMTVTFTAESSRLYKISYYMTGLKNTTSGYTDISLTDDSNNQIFSMAQYAVAANYFNGSGGVVITGISGSKTYKLRGASEVATSTPTATATVPITLIVEDIGPA